METTEDDIDEQWERLAAHRARLATLLTQQARLGRGYAPPAINTDITEARKDIRHVKGVLRNWGQAVGNHPDDEAVRISDRQTTRSPRSRTITTVFLTSGIVVAAFLSGLLVAPLLGAPISQRPTALSLIASSTFDVDTEGWTVTGGAKGPYHATSGGHPGGHGLASDASGDLWYWRAPAPFVGDQSAAYGGALIFDLQQTITGNRKDARDVVLIGAGLTLVFDIPFPPRQEWTTFALRLHETAGWKKNESGDTPTAEEMKRVLSDLTELKIRGEYSDGDDIGGIDNVLLLGRP